MAIFMRYRRGVKVVQGLFSQYYGESGFTKRMLPFLDLAALATVADIVPVKGDKSCSGKVWSGADGFGRAAWFGGFVEGFAKS